MKPFRTILHRVLKFKLCARCLKTFRCSVTSSCWCDAVQVSRENLLRIRRCYMDCLCRQCLETIEAGHNSGGELRADDTR